MKTNKLLEESQRLIEETEDLYLLKEEGLYEDLVVMREAIRDSDEPKANKILLEYRLNTWISNFAKNIKKVIFSINEHLGKEKNCLVVRARFSGENTGQNDPMGIKSPVYYNIIFPTTELEPFSSEREFVEKIRKAYKPLEKVENLTKLNLVGSTVKLSNPPAGGGSGGEDLDTSDNDQRGGNPGTEETKGYVKKYKFKPNTVLRRLKFNYKVVDIRLLVEGVIGNYLRTSNPSVNRENEVKFGIRLIVVNGILNLQKLLRVKMLSEIDDGLLSQIVSVTSTGSHFMIKFNSLSDFMKNKGTKVPKMGISNIFRQQFSVVKGDIDFAKLYYYFVLLGFLDARIGTDRLFANPMPHGIQFDGRIPYLTPAQFISYLRNSSLELSVPHSHAVIQTRGESFKLTESPNKWKPLTVRGSGSGRSGFRNFLIDYELPAFTCVEIKDGTDFWMHVRRGLRGVGKLAGQVAKAVGKAANVAINRANQMPGGFGVGQ